MMCGRLQNPVHFAFLGSSNRGFTFSFPSSVLEWFDSVKAALKHMEMDEFNG